MIIDRERALENVRDGVRPFFRGRVDYVSGVLVEATGVPAALGEVCSIDRGKQGSIQAEVVGFRGSTTLLMPHGDLHGVAPQQQVLATGQPFRVAVSDALLGRMVDGFGIPIDDGPRLQDCESRPARVDAPSPLARVRIDEPLRTGVRALDGLTTLGRGQRLGIFAGSGVGKSTLLGQITRGTDADVIICCLVGERGREVRDFLDNVLGDEGRARAVMVVATSDRAPIERYAAPFVALTIAEHFRDQGKNVLMLMDSMTRFAGAAREIGLAAGEPPTVRGYPPSFFATVPKLVERMGQTTAGSITGLITVLLEGDDANEPVADTLRGLLDGHLFLSRELAQRGHFPAIDVLASLSRLMPTLVDGDQSEHAKRIRGWLTAYRDGRDLIDIGAYKPGSNPELDAALQRIPAIDAFLQQNEFEYSPFDETLAMLKLLTGPLGGEE